VNITNIVSNTVNTSSTENLNKQDESNNSFTTIFNQTETPSSNDEFVNPNIVDMFSFVKDISLEEYKVLSNRNDVSNDEKMELAKFQQTDDYITYRTSELLKKGNEKSIAAVIEIGNDTITLGYQGGSTTPNNYARYMSGNLEDTINKLYEAFGETNVKVDQFEKGSGPTIAEFYEKQTGKSYSMHVLRDYSMN
jgi:hypothetical protein